MTTSMPSSSLSSLLENLQESIAQFTDGNVLIDSSSGNNNKENDNSIVEEESIVRRFAPPGLEEQFQQLFSVIYPNLRHHHGPEGGDAAEGYDENGDGSAQASHVSTFDVMSASSAAILMGAKGSGKSLLLERCLTAACQCSNKGNQRRRPLFHKVTINGIICRGQDVGAVVYEIIRQLSEIAFRGNTDTDHSNDDLGASTPRDSRGDTPGDDDHEQRERKRRRRLKMDKHLLRLRKSAFTSNVALMESTLKIANADGIPILLVLDELDSFLEEGERQMLLYFFLDRVATPGSNLIFIGSTSSFCTLTLLEKRIRSRAEGTAKVIYLRNPATYQELLRVLRHKLRGCVVGQDIIARLSCLPPSSTNNVCSGSTLPTLSSSTESITTTGETASEGTSETDTSFLPIIPEMEKEEAAQVSVAMEREFRLGKDLRWYSRVLSTALSLYRHECIMASTKVDFQTKHLLTALTMMGASIGDAADSASKQPDLCIVNDMAVDPRLQALLDLSTPQVALLLSAKRILTRQSHKDEAAVAPLTMDRMMKEYESFRRRASYAPFSNALLRKAMLQLLDVGLLMPTMDHSGGGPLQYCLSKSYRKLDTNTFSRVPLQIPVEIDRELAKALEQNLLACPTALKEWGKATS